MTPEKQDKTLELSKHWSVDSTLARNEVIIKRTYPVKSVKCDKICSNLSEVKKSLIHELSKYVIIFSLGPSRQKILHFKVGI